MRDVTIKQLRALAATVQAGSIVGASQLLHVTPPAVGQQVRLLERAAGVELVERTAAGLHATEAGRELIRAADRIEAELSRCARVVDAIRSGSGGRVVFGAVSTAKYVAPGILAAYRRDHPEVDVQLEIGNRQQTLDELDRHDVDLVMMGRPPADLDVVTEVIGEHPHVIIASPSHPLAAGATGTGRVSLARVAQETFLVREHGSGTRLLTEELFERRRLRLRVGMEITSNETIKQAVIAGLGIALISAHTVAAEVADGRLAVLDVERLPIVRRWYVVRRADRHLLPPAQALWDFLVDHAVEHLPAT